MEILLFLVKFWGPKWLNSKIAPWNHLHFLHLNLQTWIPGGKQQFRTGSTDAEVSVITQSNGSASLKLSTLNPWYLHKACRPTQLPSYWTHWPILYRLNWPWQPSPNIEPSSPVQKWEFLSFRHVIVRKEERQNPGAKNARHTPNTMKKSNSSSWNPLVQ